MSKLLRAGRKLADQFSVDELPEVFAIARELQKRGPRRKKLGRPRRRKAAQAAEGVEVAPGVRVVKRRRPKAEAATEPETTG